MIALCMRNRSAPTDISYNNNDWTWPVNCPQIPA